MYYDDIRCYDNLNSSVYGSDKKHITYFIHFLFCCIMLLHYITILLRFYLRFFALSFLWFVICSFEKWFLMKNRTLDFQNDKYINIRVIRCWKTKAITYSMKIIHIITHIKIPRRLMNDIWFLLSKFFCCKITSDITFFIILQNFWQKLTYNIFAPLKKWK